jgi:hypothetical protein
MLGVEPGAADLVVGEVEDLDLGEDRIRCELGGALGAEAPAAEVELPFTILVRSGIERLIEAGVTSPSVSGMQRRARREATRHPRPLRAIERQRANVLWIPP